MKSWRVRLALLTVVAVLLAVSGPAAMAQTFFNDGCGPGGCMNPYDYYNGPYNYYANPYNYYNNSPYNYYQYSNPCYGGGNVAQQALGVALC